MGKQKRYPRDESLYNLIQENEVMLFLRYLPLATWRVAGNKSLWRGRGRPPKNLHDILVCLAIRKYFNFSLRRGMGLLRLFRALGVIDVSAPFPRKCPIKTEILGPSYSLKNCEVTVLNKKPLQLSGVR